MKKENKKENLKFSRFFREIISRKKGISPVVATVLLITMAIIIIAIMFIWVRSTIKDQETKFNEPVANACDDVILSASSSSSGLSVSNNGNVPVIAIKAKSSSGKLFECSNSELVKGESKTFSNNCGAEGNVKSVIPVLQTDKNKLYICDDKEFEL